MTDTFNNIRGRLAAIAGAVINTIQLPPSIPEDGADTIESNERTIERRKQERLDRKWIQVTASFSRWVSDLFSEIPAGQIDDASHWETKHGTNAKGEPFTWLGIKGSHSIFIGGTEVCLDQIQFAVQGWFIGAIENRWVYIDDNSLDYITSNRLRYGVVDNDGNFVEVQNQKHLAQLVGLGQI